MTKRKGLSAQWLDAMNKAERSLIVHPELGPVHTDIKPLWDLVQELTKDVRVDLDAPLLDEPEGINIWVDDLRDPAKYGYPNAIWCKTSEQYLTRLMLFVLAGKIEDVVEIHFDNDLGERVEGYDLFVMLEETLHKGSLKNLKKVYVHSSNPSAVHKFMLAARSFKHHFGVDVIRQQY